MSAPAADIGPLPPWKRTAVIFQIFPLSFQDSDGDGRGDLAGIIRRLDYIRDLGCDVIWLTPIYDSPLHDNGYDIRDYNAINTGLGTMAQFEELLSQVHARDMKLIMDIVVNHTSTEHQWFLDSRSSRSSDHRDFYIWRDPAPDGGPPTNWTSKFGGPSWSYDGTTGQYYLHLFDSTQADLNWENTRVRQACAEMISWWIDKGVDGFRLDVVNLLSKDQSFPMAPPGTDGRQFYTDGPRIHEFLRELHERSFARADLITVGEMSSTSVPACVLYTRPDRREVDMTFSFHHLKVDYPFGEKWTTAPVDVPALKRVLDEWQRGMAAGGGWNALFWCNHDQPRIVSRLGDVGRYRQASAKTLATLMHLLQGTPYIYQGEELGMANPGYDSIADYRDVESLNAYEWMRRAGTPEPEVLAILAASSRDNGRSPMQWDATVHAGFTSGRPWIPVAADHDTVNAENELADPSSVYWHYRALARLRRS
ncbi:MAG TPA: alpha,alpha-phosphotrehalase, partial [Nakamurella multipartita]|nr:alpha,alpha-phosphotrehalase [Nakamurella multipartita]